MLTICEAHLTHGPEKLYEESIQTPMLVQVCTAEVVQNKQPINF